MQHVSLAELAAQPPVVTSADFTSFSTLSESHHTESHHTESRFSHSAHSSHSSSSSSEEDDEYTEYEYASDGDVVVGDTTSTGEQLSQMITSIQSLLGKTEAQIAAEMEKEAQPKQGPRPWPRAPKLIYPSRVPSHPRAVEEIQKMEAMNDKILESELIVKAVQEAKIEEVLETYMVVYDLEGTLDAERKWSFHEIDVGRSPTSLVISIHADPMWALASAAVSTTTPHPKRAQGEYVLAPLVLGASLAWTDVSGVFHIGVERASMAPTDDAQSIHYSLHVQVGGYVAPGEDLTLQWRAASTRVVNPRLVDVYGLLEASIRDYHVDAIEPHAGRTALHFAASGPSLEVASWLMDHQADPNARDRYGNTPLFAAVQASVSSPGDALQMVQLLLRSGGVVYARNRTGDTLLHMAARYELSGSIAALLLSRHADPAPVNDDGQTPLDVARRVGNERVVRLLDNDNDNNDARDSLDDGRQGGKEGEADGGGGRGDDGEEWRRDSGVVPLAVISDSCCSDDGSAPDSEEEGDDSSGSGSSSGSSSASGSSSRSGSGSSDSGSDSGSDGGYAYAYASVVTRSDDDDVSSHAGSYANLQNYSIPPSTVVSQATGSSSASLLSSDDDVSGGVDSDDDDDGSSVSSSGSGSSSSVATCISHVSVDQDDVSGDGGEGGAGGDGGEGGEEVSVFLGMEGAR